MENPFSENIHHLTASNTLFASFFTENHINVYRITDHYIDIDLLSPVNPKQHKRKRKDSMMKAKRFLQKNNIVYIDWKPDNTGLDENGNFKLFDFDASGVFNCDGD